MDAAGKPSAHHVFSLRLWREILSPDEWEWRGRILDTQTGNTHYFHDWEMLVGLLRSSVGDRGVLSEEERLERSGESTASDADPSGSG